VKFLWGRGDGFVQARTTTSGNQGAFRLPGSAAQPVRTRTDERKVSCCRFSGPAGASCALATRSTAQSYFISFSRTICRCAKCETTRQALCPSLLYASADRTCVSILGLLPAATKPPTADLVSVHAARLPHVCPSAHSSVWLASSLERIQFAVTELPCSLGEITPSRQAGTQPTSESLSVARQELPLHDAVDAHLIWLGSSPDLGRLTTESGGL